ncbi:MAG: GGDEF domain-containing protein [Clostridia bacterium]|nr:GGDEF domain-containing protein [Clostridia bacterium]
MFKTKFEKWVYGGHGREFFRANEERIGQHNRKYSGIIIAIMCLITLVYFLLNLKPLLSKEMRTSCLVFFVVSAIMHVIHNIQHKKPAKKTDLYFFFTIELVFVFLLFVGPILDSETQALYLPIFFLIVPLLPIIPWHEMSLALLFNIGIFAAVDFSCKTPDTARFDLINTITCTFLGVAIGNSIMSGRLNEIYAYNALKERSESELSIALKAANTDPLTGVRSRAAYEHAEAAINEKIGTGLKLPFGIVVCDINWLKESNDTFGHDVGDRLIKACCKVVCDVFAHSPVFRIGGDEFAVILQGADYEKRYQLLDKLSEALNYDKSGVSLARGLSVFNPAEDRSVDDVFVRADSAMYENKNRIKASRSFDDSIYAAVK